MTAVVGDRSKPFGNFWASLYSDNLSSVIYMTFGAAVVLNVIWRVRKGYENFLALGPGGTPSTFAGYLRVSYLRLYTLSDPFQPPSLALACQPDRGYLSTIGRRSAPRPKTDGIAPHRQLNQKCDPQLHQLLRNALHTLADTHPTYLRKGNSCFEKKGLALFLSPKGPLSHLRNQHLNPTCADTGEICHLHSTVRQQTLRDIGFLIAKRTHALSALGLVSAPHPPPNRCSLRYRFRLG